MALWRGHWQSLATELMPVVNPAIPVYRPGLQGSEMDSRGSSCRFGVIWSACPVVMPQQAVKGCKRAEQRAFVPSYSASLTTTPT